MFVVKTSTTQCIYWHVCNLQLIDHKLVKTTTILTVMYIDIIVLMIALSSCLYHVNIISFMDGTLANNSIGTCILSCLHEVMVF